MYNPYSYQPYSTLGNSRNQFTQSQQQQYDFSGWGDRLTSIEEGIKSLRDQFQNINVPGEEFGEQSTAPEAEYAGNTAPPPLAAAPPAAGGIPSIPVTPGAIDTGAEMIANVDPLAPTTPAGGIGGVTPPGSDQIVPGYTPSPSDYSSPDAPPVMPMGEQIGSGQPKPPLPPEVVGGDFLQSKPPPMMHSGEQPKPPPPTSMADWLQDYEFDLAPGRPEWQPGQSIQNVMQDYTNSPEYQGWQEREDERGPLSQSTWDAITGGQSMSSNAQHSVIPYIRGGGGGYEDYLSTHEKMKEARPQIEEIRNNWQGTNQRDLANQMNAVYQSVGLGSGRSGGPIGMGLGGGQQQSKQRLMAPDPTKSMGGENWKPISEEEYGRQSDLWGSHMDYGAFSQAAFNQLGTAGNDISRYKQGSNPMFGHAYEAWQKFNESQPGGPYTTPDATRDPFGQLDFSGVRPQIQGALQGPLQQQIQQGLGSLAA